MTKYYRQKARLNHYINFLENISRDELQEPEWREKFSCYADIRPVNPLYTRLVEPISFGHVVTERNFVILVRYHAEITDKLRISYNSRYFEIKQIINLSEKNKYLNIIAQEK